MGRVNSPQAGLFLSGLRAGPSPASFSLSSLVVCIRQCARLEPNEGSEGSGHRPVGKVVRDDANIQEECFHTSGF